MKAPFSSKSFLKLGNAINGASSGSSSGGKGPTFSSPFPPPPSPSSQSSTFYKLFLTGSTIGPIVDSLHNQCLLQYDRLPINLLPMHQQQQNQQLQSQQLQLAAPGSGDDLISSMMVSLGSTTTSSSYNDVLMDSTMTMMSTSTSVSSSSVPSAYLFSSSLYIPLLLGIAYVVLGDILPNGIEFLLQKITNTSSSTSSSSSSITSSTVTLDSLRTRAILAVTSTALIIKLSDFLQTHPTLFTDITTTSTSSGVAATINLTIMIIAVIIQWMTLDGKLSSLFTALIVSVGGPLSELPFVALGFWHYIPSAADYFPLAGIADLALGGEGGGLLLEDYSDLALSSITGPCYFAVTMDAIALGRWFRYNDENDDVDGAR